MLRNLCDIRSHHRGGRKGKILSSNEGNISRDSQPILDTSGDNLFEGCYYSNVKRKRTRGESVRILNDAGKLSRRGVLLFQASERPCKGEISE